MTAGVLLGSEGGVRVLQCCAYFTAPFSQAWNVRLRSLSVPGQHKLDSLEQLRKRGFLDHLNCGRSGDDYRSDRQLRQLVQIAKFLQDSFKALSS